MNTFDFSPLFRSTIGFDRLTRLIDAAARMDNSALAYPPYNIEKTGEDAYRLTMAVAGFSPDEIDITVHENSLFVTGKAKNEAENGRYLHRGIARRAFERRFGLGYTINFGNPKAVAFLVGFIGLILAILIMGVLTK